MRITNAVDMLKHLEGRNQKPREEQRLSVMLFGHHCYLVLVPFAFGRHTNCWLWPDRRTNLLLYTSRIEPYAALLPYHGVGHRPMPFVAKKHFNLPDTGVHAMLRYSCIHHRNDGWRCCHDACSANVVHWK